MGEEINIHAVAVAIDGKGVLITGKSGSGKSDLALRLVDRGAKLISDDRVILRQVGRHISMTPPDEIAGKIEVRHIGIITCEYSPANLAMIIDLDRVPPRMPPETETRAILEMDIPLYHIAPFEGSAPIKVELALQQISVQSDHNE